MAKTNLTDRFIKSRKPAASGQRDDYPDAVVPGLALRVTDRGHKSFVLVARYPLNPKNPTRRALSDVYEPPKAQPAPKLELRNGALTLGEARSKAREWLDLIARGIDPKVAEAREKAAALRQQTNTFAAVAADFLERHGKTLAKYAEAKRIIEGEFVKRWGARPITDIMPDEVSAAIRAIVKRDAPYQAHNALGYVRRLFNWAIGTHEFGITTSPVEQLRPKDLIGKRKARVRTLADEELRLVWKAAGRMGYPYGPLLRLLIISGQREREVADMSWDEINLDKKLWTIPPERMKGDHSHEVPLADDALALLKELDEHRRYPPKPKTGSKATLPLWDKGTFVFSTTRGEKPVNGFSKAKLRLDNLAAKLRAEARAGEGAKVEDQDKLPPFVLHDLRRTMRTHLSALPVQDLVRELVIAHAKPGLHKVYDQHAYRDEKRQCLELWETRLKGIVDPAAVTDLEKERAKRRGHVQ